MAQDHLDKDPQSVLYAHEQLATTDEDTDILFESFDPPTFFSEDSFPQETCFPFR